MRRLVSGALATVVVMTGMVMVTGQAAAVGSCVSPNMCLFENNDFNKGNETNHWLDLRKTDADLRNNYWYNDDGSQSNDSIDNETSSVKNRTGCNVMLWQNVGNGGDHTKSISGTDDGFLENNVIGDNRLSGVEFCV